MNFNTLSKFALSENLSDFKLILPQTLQSKELYAHKIILASNSEKFVKIFEEDKTITSYNLQTPINSYESEITIEIIEQILKFGYGEQTIDKLVQEGLDQNNSFNYFSAAKLLNFSTCEEILSKYIEQNNFQKERYLTSLFEAIKFDQGNWVYFLIKEISHNFNEYLNSPENKKKLINLPLEHIKAIIGRDDLFVQDEDRIYQFVIEYIKSKEEFEENVKNQENNEENKDQKEEIEKIDENNLNQKGEKNLKLYKLTNEEKHDILSLVRLSFVSHKFLLESVKEEILNQYKDMILEAISAKLSNYEQTQANYTINTNPRDCYKNKQTQIVQEKKQELNIQMEKSELMDSPQKEIQENQPSLLYESVQNNFLDESLPKKNDKKVEFIYNYDMDENGVFYWLGSLGRTKSYKNPYTIGLVKVFFSSISETSRLDYFVGRKLENCRTSNQEESYMGVDLGQNRLLIPKMYSIRNRDTLKHVLLNWVIEASEDQTKWFVIDKRVHLTEDEKINNQRKKERNLLLQKGAMTTWVIDMRKLRKSIEDLTCDITSFRGFRFFRIKQIGKNSSDSYNLSLSGFELYGTGYGDWIFQEKQIIKI